MPPAGRVAGGGGRSVAHHDKKRDYQALTNATNAPSSAFADFSLPARDPKNALASGPSASAARRVDLSKLETTALKKYRRHFKLADVGPNSSKEQLLYAVCRHFTAQQLDERQVIVGFVQAAKRLKT